MISRFSTSRLLRPPHTRTEGGGASVKESVFGVYVLRCFCFVAIPFIIRPSKMSVFHKGFCSSFQNCKRACFIRVLLKITFHLIIKRSFYWVCDDMEMIPIKGKRKVSRGGFSCPLLPNPL